MAVLIDDFAHARNSTPLPPGLDSLTWDTRVRELLPLHSEWILQDPVAQERMTVRDALAQMVGLETYVTLVPRYQRAVCSDYYSCSVISYSTVLKILLST